jgi:hypothetical protein
MTLIDLGWLVTLVLLAGITAGLTWAWRQRRACARSGHLWQTDVDGWYCTRCQIRRVVGDRL